MTSLQKRMYRTEELVDSIVQDFTLLCGELSADPSIASGPGPVPGAGPRRPRRGATGAAPPRPVAVAIGTLEMTMGRDGSSQVRVDGSEPFRLARSPSELLRILAADGDEGDGSIVGWKRKSDVIMQMEKRMGRRFHRHTLDNLVHRLRLRLEEMGLHPRLLETDRRRGMRLKVRRGGLLVTEAKGS